MANLWKDNLPNISAKIKILDCVFYTEYFDDFPDEGLVADEHRKHCFKIRTWGNFFKNNSLFNLLLNFSNNWFEIQSCFSEKLMIYKNSLSNGASSDCTKTYRSEK